MDTNGLTKSDTLKSKGNDCFKAAKYEDAIDYYSKAIAVCNVDDHIQLSILYCNRAFANFKLKRMQATFDDASHAFSLNPKYDKPLYYRYKASYAIGNLCDALADLTAVCILQNESSKSIVIERDQDFVAYCAAQMRNLPPNKAKIQMADSFIKDYFKDFSNHPIADSSFTAEKLLKLLSDLKNSKNDRNRDAKIALIEGTICTLNDDVAVGEMWLSSAVNVVKDDKKLQVTALISLAFLKYLQIKAKETISLESVVPIMGILERAMQVDETNADIWFHRSQVFLELCDQTSAFRDLERCISLSSSFELPHVSRFNALCEVAVEHKDKQKFDQLCRDMEAYLNRNPNSDIMYYTYSHFLMDNDHLIEADKNVSKAISLNSENVNYYLLKAEIAVKKSGSKCAGIPHWLEALNVDEHIFSPYENLSIVEAENGNLCRAIVYVDKGLAMVKRNSDRLRLCVYREMYYSRFRACKTLGINYLDAKYPMSFLDYYHIYSNEITNCLTSPEFRRLVSGM